MTQNYDVFSVVEAARRIETRIAEINTQRLTAPLQYERAVLEADLAEIHRSGVWKNALDLQKDDNKRQHERALTERLADRSQRILQEREQFNRKVDSIDWSLVKLPEYARRQVAQEHIAKLDKANQQHELLNSPEADLIIREQAALHGFSYDAIRQQMARKAFETRAIDRETGSHYLLITDPDGFTYAAPDLSNE